MKTEFEIIHKGKSSPAAILEVLRDFRRFSVLHPMIERIEETGPEKYLVFEPIKLGPVVLYKNTYKADISSTTDRVRYFADVRGMVFLDIEFFIATRNNEEHLVENIIVTGPPIITQVMKFLVGRMHKKIIASI